jgi:acetyltransferase-like isoleucine patch superfamily enzyme
MTIKEKRAAGEYYAPSESAELREEYLRAADLLFRYNSTPFSDTAARTALLRELLGSMQDDCRILSPFHCDFGYNIHIGRRFFANTGLVILDTASVEIGDDVLIGPQVGLYAAYHPVDVERRAAGLEASAPIRICDKVWIGGHVSVLPGVTIGEGSVIGAGSVVTHDIPPRKVAYGNPCHVVRDI